MGNTQSNIVERLDDIATEYILDADFQTLSKMKDKDYCNKVTIVTKDILDKQFDHLDIEYLATRAKNGWDRTTSFFQNPFGSKKTPSTDAAGLGAEKPHDNLENTLKEEKKDDNTVTFTTKENVGYVTTIDNPNKDEMCLSISSFYVKIGHIFAAIVGTIRPKYVFQNGKEASILTPKAELASETGGDAAAVFQLAENGFCFQKIEALKHGTYKDPSVVNPQFCNTPSENNTAEAIPGVPEFEMLYYDETDPQGNPTMSDKNLIAYRKDLATFYTKFTGNPSLPNDLHRFRDIPLKSPKETEERCQNNTYNQAIKPIQSSRENPLFQDYANNLREMIQVTGGLQSKLVDILNRLFTKKKEGQKITIQPKLTLADLDKMIVETRNVLLELFLRCEEYFENGVNIYKAIVDDRIINHTFEEFLLPETITPPPPPSTADFMKSAPPSTVSTADFMSPDFNEYQNQETFAAEDDGMLSEPEQPFPPPQGFPSPEPPLPLPPSPAPTENQFGEPSQAIDFGSDLGNEEEEQEGNARPPPELVGEQKAFPEGAVPPPAPLPLPEQQLPQPQPIVLQQAPAPPAPIVIQAPAPAPELGPAPLPQALPVAPAPVDLGRIPNPMVLPGASSVVAPPPMLPESPPPVEQPVPPKEPSQFAPGPAAASASQPQQQQPPLFFPGFSG